MERKGDGKGKVRRRKGEVVIDEGGRGGGREGGKRRGFCE